MKPEVLLRRGQQAVGPGFQCCTYVGGLAFAVLASLVAERELAVYASPSLVAFTCTSRVACAVTVTHNVATARAGNLARFADPSVITGARVLTTDASSAAQSAAGICRALARWLV